MILRSKIRIFFKKDLTFFGVCDTITEEGEKESIVMKQTDVKEELFEMCALSHSLLPIFTL